MIRTNLSMLACASLVLVAASVRAQPTWVESSGKSCADSCQSKSLFAIKSGTYQNDSSFYVCATNKNNEGFRPGFNLVKTWADKCTVGHGGQEHLESSYYCLCNDKTVSPPGK